MRVFSFRPSFTLRGRTFKGLRGWAGKPLHPPLTDIPVAAYLFAAAFDLISFAAGDGRPWARDFYRAGSFVLIGGAAVSVLAAVTGFWDWLRSTPKGTQARRATNAHAITMVAVTGLVLADVAVRAFAAWDEPAAPIGVVVLSVVVALLGTAGATIGGSLVFDYGFNVETDGDSPVWHPSQADLLPGQKPPAAPTAPDRGDPVPIRSDRH